MLLDPVGLREEWRPAKGSRLDRELDAWARALLDEADVVAARAAVAHQEAAGLAVINSTDWRPAVVNDLAAALVQLPALDLLAGRIDRVMTERTAATAAARLTVARTVRQLATAAGRLSRARKSGRGTAVEFAQRDYDDIRAQMLEAADA